MTKIKPTPAELAAKIEHAGDRYEFASKVEVRAYVEIKLERLAEALETQLSEFKTAGELELTFWQRLKRWWSRRISRRRDRKAARPHRQLRRRPAPPNPTAPASVLPSRTEAPAVKWTGDPECLKGTPLEGHYHKGVVARIDKGIDIAGADGKTTEVCHVGDWLVLTAAGLRTIPAGNVILHHEISGEIRKDVE